jgi:hypothetical protein
MTSATGGPDLLFGGGLEPDHQLGGYPAAVPYLDALRFGPLANLGGIQPARRCPASGSGWLLAAPGPPRRIHITRQRIPQRLGVPGIQVDLILGAV